MSKISFHTMLSIIKEFSRRFSINILLGFLHWDKATYKIIHVIQIFVIIIHNT